MISTDSIKELRSQTGISVMQCKSALEEAEGDMDKAVMLLKKKSKDIALKKSDRAFGAGTVSSYIHAGGAVGVIVELSCETDFVSKNEEFKKLGYDIAMHIAAANPEFITLDEVSEEERRKVSEMFEKEVNESGKPETIKEKILSGKLDAYFNERILLKQSFIKNPEVTVEGLIELAIQKFGERVKIARYSRFAV